MNLVYSNNPVELKQLEESKNSVLIGQWEEGTDGGCHLYDEPHEKDISKKTWSLNPKFHLQFKNLNGPIHLKITLTIAEKNWKIIAKVINI